MLLHVCICKLQLFVSTDMILLNEVLLMFEKSYTQVIDNIQYYIDQI